jgi:uncharacterized protein (TIGR02284 family)
MLDVQELVGILEKLIETCRDGQAGYREAAEHIDNPELKGFFNEQSIERAQFAGQLESEVQRLGEMEPQRRGSAGAALHRAWIDLKSNLGAGDQAILSSVEQGEDVARKAYEDTLKKDLPQHIANVIRSQAESIFAAYDHIKLLHQKRAA